MAVSYLGRGGASGSASAPAPTMPSSLAANDVVVLVYETNGEAVPTPSSWTAMGALTQSSGSPTRLSLFWRRLSTGSETAPTLTDTGDHGVAVILGFRGCATSGTPFDIQMQANASSTSAGAPPVITATDSLVAAIWSCGTDTDTATFGTPTLNSPSGVNSFTMQYNVMNTSGDGGGLIVATGEAPGVADTGAITATMGSAATTVGATILFHAQGSPAVSPLTHVHTTSASTANTDTVTVAKPTGTASGDLLIFALASNEGTFTRPSGLTLVHHETNADTTNSFSGQVYYKIAGGSEPANYTWSVTPLNGAPMAIVCTAWRGFDATDPIQVSISDAGGDGIEPAPQGATLNTTLTQRGRRFGARMSRANTSPNPLFTMNAETPGSTILAQDANFSGGSIRYGTVLFVRDYDDAAASWPMARTSINDDDETDNVYVHFTVNPIQDPSEGPIAAQVPSITSTFTGERVMPDGPLVSQVPSIAAVMTGVATPPEGSLTSSVPLLSTAFTGGTASGGVTATTPSITSAWTGGNVHGGVTSMLPSLTSTWDGGSTGGAFTAQLGALSASFTSETRPFGEHVIRPEVEHRAFLVTDDGTGLIEIKRSKVTQP